MLNKTWAERPVRHRDCGVELLPWGRCTRQPGEQPLDGSAGHESIQEGRWDTWQPIPVKLTVNEFMEKDGEYLGNNAATLKDTNVRPAFYCACINVFHPFPYPLIGITPPG